MPVAFLWKIFFLQNKYFISCGKWMKTNNLHRWNTIYVNKDILKMMIPINKTNCNFAN